MRKDKRNAMERLGANTQGSILDDREEWKNIRS